MRCMCAPIRGYAFYRDIYNKNILDGLFSYNNPCCYLEGTKDALCHRDTFLTSEQCKALCVSRGLLSRSMSLEQSEVIIV